MKNQEEVRRRRMVAKDIIYPFLLQNTKSIHDARRMCEIMAKAIQQKYQMKMMEKQKLLSAAPISELELEGDMSQDDSIKRDRELLALLSGETVASAVELIDGMDKALESFLLEESDGRPLNSLTTHFL